jgi:hypothetical protein
MVIDDNEEYPEKQNNPRNFIEFEIARDEKDED